MWKRYDYDCTGDTEQPQAGGSGVGTSRTDGWNFSGGPVVRVHLPTQGTQVQSLVWEGPTGYGATKPVHHKYWACVPAACAPQQEEPPQ